MRQFKCVSLHYSSVLKKFKPFTQNESTDWLQQPVKHIMNKYQLVTEQRPHEQSIGWKLFRSNLANTKKLQIEGPDYEGLKVRGGKKNLDFDINYLITSSNMWKNLSILMGVYSSIVPENTPTCCYMVFSNSITPILMHVFQQNCTLIKLCYLIATADELSGIFYTLWYWIWQDRIILQTPELTFKLSIVLKKNFPSFIAWNSMENSDSKKCAFWDRNHQEEITAQHALTHTHPSTTKAGSTKNSFLHGYKCLKLFSLYGYIYNRTFIPVLLVFEFLPAKVQGWSCTSYCMWGSLPASTKLAWLGKLLFCRTNSYLQYLKCSGTMMRRELGGKGHNLCGCHYEWILKHTDNISFLLPKGWKTLHCLW